MAKSERKKTCPAQSGVWRFEWSPPGGRLGRSLWPGPPQSPAPATGTSIDPRYTGNIETGHESRFLELFVFLVQKSIKLIDKLIWQ